MNSVATPSSVSIPSPGTAAPELCLFHDGLATLDVFLAELDPRDRELFDAALDLRSLATGGDAVACIKQLFCVRALLDGRHYLAFYRVRCWAHRAFRVEVRTHRATAALTRAFPRDGGRLDEVVNSALAAVADTNGEIPAGAHVRFVFASAA